MEIKPYKSKKYFYYILIIGVFSFISITLHGADAPVTTAPTINNATPGKPVIVPITVTGFTGIGSFYLYLEYDYTKIQYTSATKNPLLTGNFNINDHDLGGGIHRVIFSWSGGIYGISLANGSSIVDVVFNYVAGSAELKWNTSNDNFCAYTDPAVNRLKDSPKSTFYVNGVVSGSISPAPLIPLNNKSGDQLSVSNYPNPFSKNTTIEYIIPVDGKVVIQLYNRLGQQVASPVNAIRRAGKYSVDCSLSRLLPGIYFARITLSGRVNLSRTIELCVVNE